MKTLWLIWNGSWPFFPFVLRRPKLSPLLFRLPIPRNYDDVLRSSMKWSPRGLVSLPPPSPTLTVFKQLTWGILIRVSIWAFEFPTFVCRVFKNKSVRIKIFWKARVYLWLGCVDVANEWLECGLNRIHHTSPKVFTCHYMRSPRISCCDTIRITATEIGWRSYIIV